MERRRELLAAVEANLPAAFVSFVQSAVRGITLSIISSRCAQKSRSSEFDLDEFFQTFSRNEFVLLFNALQVHLQRVVPADATEEELSQLESKVGWLLCYVFTSLGRLEALPRCPIGLDLELFERQSSRSSRVTHADSWHYARCGIVLITHRPHWRRRFAFTLVGSRRCCGRYLRAVGNAGEGSAIGVVALRFALTRFRGQGSPRTSNINLSPRKVDPRECKGY
jgi:hypothetical protein